MSLVFLHVVLLTFSTDPKAVTKAQAQTDPGLAERSATAVNFGNSSFSVERS